METGSMKAMDVADVLTVDEVVAHVAKYRPWFEKQSVDHGWLSRGYGAEDLMQDFVAHALRYDVAGRFDPAKASKSTYMMQCMRQFVQHRRLYLSRKRRRPAVLASMYTDDASLGALATMRQANHVNHVDRLETKAALERLALSFEVVGDTASATVLRAVWQANGNLPQAAKAMGWRSASVKRALAYIAQTPIGREVRRMIFE